MNVKSVAKLVLAFSACFVSVTLLGTMGWMKGYLSPRGLGVFLALVCLGSFVFLTIAFRRLARHQVTQAPAAGTASSQLLLIRMYKVWIVVLVLCLVSGVVEGTRVRPIPFLPMLVGIIMNLLITWALAQTIRKLQKGLSERHLD